MKPKRKPGRPRKLTLDKVKAVAGWIALGMTEEQACCHEDVNLESFRTAKKRNPEFEPAIKKAQAAFLARALKAIANGGEDDEQVRWGSDGKPKITVVGRKPWTGLAWILERRHKPQFNRTDTFSETTPTGEPVLSPEIQAVLSAHARELAKALAK